jgi:hypothetical protein
MIKRGFFYGITGLIFERLWTGLCSLAGGDMSLAAHTSLLMLPIYGMVVFLEPMFGLLPAIGIPTVIRGLSYMLMIFACEYFSGRLLTQLGICPWVYKSSLNVGGVIRADYAPLWFCVGLVYERLFYILPNKDKISEK